MKLQFGKKQLVLELSASPFAWFHGQTERMSLTRTPFGLFNGSTGRMAMFSLTLLFIEFRVLRRLPATTA